VGKSIAPDLMQMTTLPLWLQRFRGYFRLVRAVYLGDSAEQPKNQQDHRTARYLRSYPTALNDDSGILTPCRAPMRRISSVLFCLSRGVAQAEKVVFPLSEMRTRLVCCGSVKPRNSLRLAPKIPTQDNLPGRRLVSRPVLSETKFVYSKFAKNFWKIGRVF